MPDRWTPVPEKAPYKDPFTQQSDPASGPFFEARLTYFEAEVDQDSIRPGRHPYQLYLSAQSIREACELPGSPLVCLTRAQYDDLKQRLAASTARISGLLDDLDELQSREASLEPDAIAAEVARRLEDTFARKTGPKKAA